MRNTTRFFAVPLVLILTAGVLWLLARQGAFSTRNVPDLLTASDEIHRVVSGSLILSGAPENEKIQEKSFLRKSSSGTWKEYRTKILVDDSFPVESWLQGLKASLDYEGAVLTTRKIHDGVALEICFLPRNSGGEILVETLIVRTYTPPRKINPPMNSVPKIALVMDDLGQSPSHWKKLAALGIPFTASILPDLPYSKWTAHEAAAGNIEILLHLPMEPVDFPEKQPGRGALLSAMTVEELQHVLINNLNSVPGLSGVNNHMGSQLTTEVTAMETLMAELKPRKFFFLDSRTSSKSIAFETAVRFRVPAAQRDIFLDARDDKDFIRGQIEKLLYVARRKGAAIGIGHPYANTLSILGEMRDYLLESEIEWVPVSELLREDPSVSDPLVSSLPPGVR